jgi:signal transduction histidine kinase
VNLARASGKRGEGAVDRSSHLLLEIGRLAQDPGDIGGFLGAVAERLAILVDAERVTFTLYDEGRRVLDATPSPGPSLPCDPAASDLLSQVVFAGRVYRGALDLDALTRRRYAPLAELWADAAGTPLLIAPWRAGDELRGPLTLLNGYVSMLADGSQAPDRLDTILPILQTAIVRMNVMVDQFLESTRVAAGVRLRLRTIDLRIHLRAVANRVAARWQRGDDLDLDLPDDPVPVAVDPTRVETAIANPIDNAFKYSPQRSVVRCVLRRRGDQAHLLVEDEGMGMTADEMASLFVPFGHSVTTRNSHIGGIGLGLYLSREIVRMHRGDITVDSAPRAGTRVALTLPLVHTPGATAGGSDTN